jgi:hypothetical protein
MRLMVMREASTYKLRILSFSPEWDAKLVLASCEMIVPQDANVNR